MPVFPGDEVISPYLKKRTVYNLSKHKKHAPHAREGWLWCLRSLFMYTVFVVVLAEDKRSLLFIFL